MNKQDPSEVLARAREAVFKHDFPAALDAYRWFYDHALDIDASYYGVRLSYCLSEWADLGRQFPAAFDDLILLKETARNNFGMVKSYSCFHEFTSLCEVLDCPNEAFQVFCEIQDQELAAQLFKHVYPYCASNAMWDLCYRYLGNGEAEYKRSLAMFDHMLAFSTQQKVEMDADEEAKASLVQVGLEAFTREAGWLLIMLQRFGAPTDLDDYLRKLKQDLRERKHDHAFLTIQAAMQAEN